MRTYLFVYGTLMRGECRSGHLAGETFVGEARTAAGYRLYDVGAYPALAAAGAGGSILGELWQVSDAKLRALDEVEGVDDGLYRRQAIRLEPPHDGLDVTTYIYLPSVSGLPDISPCWRER